MFLDNFVDYLSHLSADVIPIDIIKFLKRIISFINECEKIENSGEFLNDFISHLTIVISSDVIKEPYTKGIVIPLQLIQCCKSGWFMPAFGAYIYYKYLNLFKCMLYCFFSFCFFSFLDLF